MPCSNRDGKAVQSPEAAADEDSEDESVRFVMRRHAQPPAAPTARVPEVEEGVLPRASMILDYIARTETQQQTEEAGDSQRQTAVPSHWDSDNEPTDFSDTGELIKQINEHFRLLHPEMAAQIDDRRYLVISDSPPPPRARPAATPVAPRSAPAPRPAAPEVPAAQTPRPSSSATRKTVASMFAAKAGRETPSPVVPAAVPDVPSTPVNPPTTPIVPVHSHVPSEQPAVACVPPTRPAASEVVAEQTVRPAVSSVPPVVSNQPMSVPMFSQPTPTVAAPQRVYESPQPHGEARRELPGFRAAQTPVQPPLARLPNPPPSAPRIGSTWMTSGPRASGPPAAPMANGRGFVGHTPRAHRPFVHHHHAEPLRFRQAPTSGPLFREERPIIPVRVPEDLRPPPPRYSHEYAEDTHRTFDHFGGRPARRQPPPPPVPRSDPPAVRDRPCYEVTRDMFDEPDDRWSRADDRWRREAERTRWSDFYRSSPTSEAKVAAVQAMTAEELLQVMTKEQMCGIFSKLINISTDTLSDVLAGNSRQSTSRATNRATETKRSVREHETSTAPKGYACSRELIEVNVLPDSDWTSDDEVPPQPPPPYQPVGSPPRPLGGAGGDAGDSFLDRWSPQPAERSPVPPPPPAGVYTNRNVETSDEDEWNGEEEDEVTDDERPQQSGGNQAAASCARRSPFYFINSSDEEEEEEE